MPKLYAAWKAERDPARRAQIGVQVVDAIMHEIELPQRTIFGRVGSSRRFWDGKKPGFRILRSKKQERQVTVSPLCSP